MWLESMPLMEQMMRKLYSLLCTAPPLGRRMPWGALGCALCLPALMLCLAACFHQADAAPSVSSGMASYMPSAERAAPHELTGAWTAGNSDAAMIFKGNICCVLYDDDSACGTYTIADGELSIQLYNGRTINFACKIQGNELILDNGKTVLIKQQAFEDSAESSPIEGTWLGGAITLIFHSGQYKVMRGMQVVEAGTFQAMPAAVLFLPKGMGAFVKKFSMDAQTIYLDKQRYERQEGGLGEDGGSLPMPQDDGLGNAPAAQGFT